MAKKKNETAAPASNAAASNEVEELNPREEVFALMLASGKTQYESYCLAYPKARKWKRTSVDPEASKLAGEPKIITRVRRLQAQIEAKVVDDAVVTREWIVDRLKEVAARCMQALPVRDKKGELVMVPIETASGDVELRAIYTFDSSGANRALELLGKAEGGTFIERKEVGNPGEFERLDRSARERRIAERAARLGVNVVPIKRRA